MLPSTKTIRKITNILKHMVYAQYWTAMATTGAATRQEVITLDNKKLTDEEKIDDALEAAKRHINLMSEIIDEEL